MHTSCVNSTDNGKSNDSDPIFVIREYTRLKHRCPSEFYKYPSYKVMRGLNITNSLYNSYKDRRYL